jgi:hypothetical protein
LPFYSNKRKNIVKKILIVLGMIMTVSLTIIAACTPPPPALVCGDVDDISYHQNLGHFITPEDLQGRWYVVGTTMEPNGSTWGKGQCPQQEFAPLPAPQGQAIFTENGTWINPTGGFSGINTMPDINKPYNMVFTQPDGGVFSDLLTTPWKLFARGSEPADYMALYFCRPMPNGSVLPPLQGMDILTRTQDPVQIAAIEQEVLALAETQGIYIDHYLPLNQQGCEPIGDFENQ